MRNRGHAQAAHPTSNVSVLSIPGVDLVDLAMASNTLRFLGSLVRLEQKLLGWER